VVGLLANRCPKEVSVPGNIKAPFVLELGLGWGVGAPAPTLSFYRAGAL